MATVTLRKNLQQNNLFKVSKNPQQSLQQQQPRIVTVPRKLNLNAISLVSELLKSNAPQYNVPTKINVTSPVSSDSSSLSCLSSTLPQFTNSQINTKLTKANVEFFNNTNCLWGSSIISSSVSSAMCKFSHLDKWITSTPYYRAAYQKHNINYLNQYTLLFNDPETRQHVENISYVYNIDEFTKSLPINSNENENELIMGDDCEQFYYRKMAKPQLFVGFELNNDTDDIFEEQTQFDILDNCYFADNSQFPVTDFNIASKNNISESANNNHISTINNLNQDVEFDPNFFEEPVGSPLTPNDVDIKNVDFTNNDQNYMLVTGDNNININNFYDLNQFNGYDNQLWTGITAKPIDFSSLNNQYVMI